MPQITFEQALFLRPDHQSPRLLAQSPRFESTWITEVEAIIHGFGERPAETMRCPLDTVFGMPLTDKHIAVVRVRDDFDGSINARLRPGERGFDPTGLRFHFVVVEKSHYEAWIRDPFILAAKIEPTWDAPELPMLALPTEGFSPRAVTQIQEVLKRVKKTALKVGDNPDAPDFERTAANSESPVLLGGTQILVDGGRLIFERPKGDLALASGLWLLLPEGTRAYLWPTSFAFSRELEFDVLMVPHVNDELRDGYSTEDQAADYPQGAYELALQVAAEAGDQKELDAVFSRRDSRRTIRLALITLAVVCILVLISRLMRYEPPDVNKPAAAAGIVAVGEPWTALGLLTFGDMLWKEKQ
jgi:hypothetical protein